MNVIYIEVYNNNIKINCDNDGILLYKFKHCIEMHLSHVEK